MKIGERQKNKELKRMLILSIFRFKQIKIKIKAETVKSIKGTIDKAQRREKSLEKTVNSL